MTRKIEIGVLVCFGLGLLALFGCSAQTSSGSANSGPTAVSTTADQSQPQGGNRTLVVLSYGGLWQQSFQKAVIDPFEVLIPE